MVKKVDGGIISAYTGNRTAEVYRQHGHSMIMLAWRVEITVTKGGLFGSETNHPLADFTKTILGIFTIIGNITKSLFFAIGRQYISFKKTYKKQ